MPCAGERRLRGELWPVQRSITVHGAKNALGHSDQQLPSHECH